MFYFWVSCSLVLAHLLKLLYSNNTVFLCNFEATKTEVKNRVTFLVHKFFVQSALASYLSLNPALLQYYNVHSISGVNNLETYSCSTIQWTTSNIVIKNLAVLLYFDDQKSSLCLYVLFPFKTQFTEKELLRFLVSGLP